MTHAAAITQYDNESPEHGRVEMGWKQWSAVAVVIGGGIVLQIPGHDEMPMDPDITAHDWMPAEMAEPAPPYTTVALHVTGMT